MNRYRSWSALQAQLEDLLCGPLKGRISFFLTRYHKVHSAYGRAAIRLDGRELVRFSWIEMYRQEHDVHRLWEETGTWTYNDPALKEKWDAGAVYGEADFLSAAASFLEMPVREALESDSCIIRILAILDRRVGRRTLLKIKERADYLTLPDWVRQFYELRLSTLESS